MPKVTKLGRVGFCDSYTHKITNCRRKKEKDDEVKVAPDVY
jgi:hypothetical protein